MTTKAEALALPYRCEGCGVRFADHLELIDHVDECKSIDENRGEPNVWVILSTFKENGRTIAWHAHITKKDAEQQLEYYKAVPTTVDVHQDWRVVKYAPIPF